MVLNRPMPRTPRRSLVWTPKQMTRGPQVVTALMAHKRRSKKRSPVAKQRQCAAFVKDTRTGRERRCRNKAQPGSLFCATHNREDQLPNLGF